MTEGRITYKNDFLLYSTGKRNKYIKCDVCDSTNYWKKSHVVKNAVSFFQGYTCDFCQNTKLIREND